MKTSRLFSILMLLVEKRKVTSTELAQIFEVSVRTIYRDIDILAQAGIPLYTTTGKYGGIHLMEGFVVDKAMFNEREKEEIIISLQSIKNLPGVDIERVRNKISSIFNHQTAANREWLEIDFASTTTDGDDLFATIKYAIQNKKALRICYMNAKGGDTERVIEPLQLAFRYMSWYLFAYCKMRKKYRWFKITRIIDIELLHRSFTQEHDKVNIPEILNATGEGKLTHVELVFSRDVAHFVYDAFDKKYIQREKDIISVSMDKELDEWFFITLSCFGSYVTIVEPPNLKKIIYERHKKALSHYSKDMGAD